MKNVHSLNQDDVLSGDGKGKGDDLSPSAFPDDEIVDEESPKKGSSKAVMISGIAVAVLMVLFFVWKIFAPHFQRQQEPEGFQQIPTNQQPQQSPQAQQTPPQAQPDTSGPIAVNGTNGQVAAPMPVASQPLGVPVQPVPTQAVQMQPVPVQPVATTSVYQAIPAAAVTTDPARVPTESLAQVNARLDGLERSIISIQEMINRMAVNQRQIAQVAAKPVVSPDAPRAPRHAARPRAPKASMTAGRTSLLAADSPTLATKAEPKEEKSTVRLEPLPRATLKAVLEGRAWFQAKNGETITVSPGEEVPGLGIVKSIDIDRGEVRFNNGAVVQ